MQEQQTIDLTHLNDTEPVAFTVYRDGQVDTEYYKAIERTRRVEAVKSVFKSAGDTICYYTGNIAHNVALDVKMAITDKLEGTNFRSDYHARLKRERIARKAGEFGLAA